MIDNPLINDEDHTRNTTLKNGWNKRQRTFTTSSVDTAPHAKFFLLDSYIFYLCKSQ